jgi:hypothetical protein
MAGKIEHHGLSVSHWIGRALLAAFEGVEGEDGCA